MSTPSWSTGQIKTALRRLGWTQGRIADHLHVSPATVSKTLRDGSCMSVVDFVAQTIGVHPSDLWERYHPLWGRQNQSA